MLERLTNFFNSSTKPPRSDAKTALADADTAIINAAYRKDIASIKNWLNTTGSDVNQYFGKKTLLTIAVEIPSSSLVKLLCAHHANPLLADEKGKTPLALATEKNGEIEQTLSLVSLGFVDAGAEKAVTPNKLEFEQIIKTLKPYELREAVRTEVLKTDPHASTPPSTPRPPVEMRTFPSRQKT